MLIAAPSFRLSVVIVTLSLPWLGRYHNTPFIHIAALRLDCQIHMEM